LIGYSHRCGAGLLVAIVAQAFCFLVAACFRSAISFRVCAGRRGADHGDVVRFDWPSKAAVVALVDVLSRCW